MINECTFMNYLEKSIGKNKIYESLHKLRTIDPNSYYKKLNILIEDFKTDISEGKKFADFNPEPFTLSDIKESVSLEDNSITRIGHLLGFMQLKILMIENWNANHQSNFLISNGTVLKGRVLNEVTPYKQTLTLMKIMEGYNNDGLPVYKISFIGDKEDKREKGKLVTELKKDFRIYQFEANHKEYLLLYDCDLSDKIELQNCIIEGTEIQSNDWLQTGFMQKFKTERNIIMVHTVHTNKPTFNNIKKIKKFKSEDWFGNLLYHCKDGKVYRQPQYFEYLLSASLICHPYNGYPVHLMIIARQGTGKTTIEECLWDCYDETTEIVEGSCSTIKSIVPSFKGNLPSPGAILKSNRVCVIDEFLRLLMRVESDDRKAQLASLNPILEWKTRRVSSGNGSLLMSPTARVLMVTNPVWGTNTMDQLAEHIDNSFLSRLFVWYQSEEHIRWVQKYDGVDSSKRLIDKGLFLGIVDFMKEQKSSFDFDELKKLFEAGNALLNQGPLKDILNARYLHHLKCLMDGIIKTRFLIGEKKDLKADDGDWKLITEIYMRLLSGWGVPGIEIGKE